MRICRVRVRVRERVRARAGACVCVYVCACACVRECVCVCARPSLFKLAWFNLPPHFTLLRTTSGMAVLIAVEKADILAMPATWEESYNVP